MLETLPAGAQRELADLAGTIQALANAFASPAITWRIEQLIEDPSKAAELRRLETAALEPWTSAGIDLLSMREPFRSEATPDWRAIAESVARTLCTPSAVDGIRANHEALSVGFRARWAALVRFLADAGVELPQEFAAEV